MSACGIQMQGRRARAAQTDKQTLTPTQSISCCNLLTEERRGTRINAKQSRGPMLGWDTFPGNSILNERKVEYHRQHMPQKLGQPSIAPLQRVMLACFPPPAHRPAGGPPPACSEVQAPPLARRYATQAPVRALVPNKPPTPSPAPSPAPARVA